MTQAWRTMIRVARIGAFAAFLIPTGTAFAQLMPLEIPFVDEWMASPHARVAGVPFNYWNKDGEIPPACARCHSTYGFLDYLGADGSPAGSIEKPALIGSVIGCVACHNPVTAKLTTVTFPSGKKVEGLGREAVCMTCHQGRESSDSVEKAIAGMQPDAVSEKLAFINIHYREAAATRYGSQARGGYEYPGKTYAGYFLHDKEATTCRDCHNRHTVQVKPETCTTCHRQVKAKKDYRDIRRTKDDYDGNGNTQEGIAVEVDALHKQLLAAIQTYAANALNRPIAYEPARHPYYFQDKNGNGKVDPDEAVAANRYQSWTPRLLKAAYNYQYVAKDPGAYAHNPAYVVQLMYDGLADLGEKIAVNMTGKVRPKP